MNKQVLSGSTPEEDEKLISRLFADLPRQKAQPSDRERVWMRIQNHIRSTKLMGRQAASSVGWGYLLWPRTLVRVGTTFLVVILALTLVGGAARAQPGQTLYPVKIAAEQVELVWAAGDEAKVKVGIKHAKRRLQEVQTLVQGNKDSKIVQETLDALKSTTDEVVKVATTPEANPELASQATELAAEQEQVLATVGNDASAEIKEAVQNAITAAKESISILSGDDVKGVTSAEPVLPAAPSTTPAVLASPSRGSANQAKNDATMDAGIQIDEVITIEDDNVAIPVGK